jgi:predicted nucleic acid-binding protein
VYLIDTMVLSELRRRQRDADVVAWIAEQRQEECVVQGYFYSIQYTRHRFEPNDSCRSCHRCCQPFLS